MIEILQPGLLTTIQDSGRNGYEAYGVPRSGFFDLFLAEIANRLIGNQIDAPLLEFAMIGPTVVFEESCAIAITGFEVTYKKGNQVIPQFQAFSIEKGSVLQFGGMKGWFGYIAVAGGIRGEKVLGSVSTHFSANLGKKLSKGDRLETGDPADEFYELRKEAWSFPEDAPLDLLPACHTEDFLKSELRKITEQDYVVSSQSNRMGIRLEGSRVESPILKRSVPALIGAVQVPGSGMPIILGPEGPTTGGYAQIGIISRVSWTVLAAKTPGSSLTFSWIEPEKARTDWNDRKSLFVTPDAWRRL